MGQLPEVKGADPVMASTSPQPQMQTRAPAPRRKGRSSLVQGSKPSHSGSLLQHMPMAVKKRQHLEHGSSPKSKRPASKPPRAGNDHLTPMGDVSTVRAMPLKPAKLFNLQGVTGKAGDGIPSQYKAWRPPMNQSYDPRPDFDDPEAPSIARGKTLLAAEEEGFKGTLAAAPSFMKRKKLAPVDPLNKFSTSFRIRDGTQQQPHTGALPPIARPKRPLRDSNINAKPSRSSAVPENVRNKASAVGLAGGETMTPQSVTKLPPIS